MFQVNVDSLQAYLDFDPRRKADLQKLDGLMRKSAPDLKRHFHAGTPAGEAGMRMKMIGYGKFSYAIKSGKTTPWPVIGMALQKNYISIYVTVTKGGAPIVSTYAGRLGEKRRGGNNFSFEAFDDLDPQVVSSLFGEVGRIFSADPENPVRYMEGR
jgi:hypothetical protein